VFDEDGGFEKRLNKSMVELEAIAPDEQPGRAVNGEAEVHALSELVVGLSGRDAWRLRCLIENHARYTASTRAREILDNWDEMLPKFRKVMPVEYRRALAELERAERDAQPALAAGA
jgi:glutamate synthase (NADPH/NADH) large chain